MPIRNVGRLTPTRGAARRIAAGTTAAGWTNAGALLLTHGGAGGGQSATLTVNGTLVNAIGAVLRAEAGIGGGPRAVAAVLDNRGLVDVHRQIDPDNPDLFTWWAPWRNLKQRNIGWRLDYLFASESLASRATSCVVQREFGTSDHGPVIAVFDV